MVEFTRILSPVDFSEQARHTLRYAVAVARWHHSTITALHVHSGHRIVESVPEFAMVEYDVLSPAQEQRISSELRRFVEQDGPIDVPLHVVVASGDITREILKQAEAMPADLVVVGTHGRSGFERLILGSVTEKILRKAPCPVMSVPPRRAAEDAASTPLFERILCPVDFSECSMLALNDAISLARKADARLTVVHVQEFLGEAEERLRFPVVNLDEYRRRYERECQERLAQAIPESARADGRIETVFAAGRAYREILRIAGELRADLIAMGVRGRGAVDRFFFGSTTNQVVRQASCPVLTFREP